MIEFQFFNGCPNADVTLTNLKAAMNELGMSDNNLKITDVPDIASAQRLSFQGSPSIIINGKDIYTGLEPKGFNYCCRLYDFSGKRTGIIPTEFIKSKLKSV